MTVDDDYYDAKLNPVFVLRVGMANDTSEHHVKGPGLTSSMMAG